MTRLVIAALALLLATLAWAAWSLPTHAQTTADVGGDTLVIRESEGHFAEILYSNSVGQVSKGGDKLLVWDGTAFDVKIEISVDGEGRERITVYPRDPGLIAFPVEADVTDGEYVVIQIMTPMF